MAPNSIAIEWEDLQCYSLRFPGIRAIAVIQYPSPQLLPGSNFNFGGFVESYCIVLLLFGLILF